MTGDVFPVSEVSINVHWNPINGQSAHADLAVFIDDSEYALSPGSLLIQHRANTGASLMLVLHKTLVTLLASRGVEVGSVLYPDHPVDPDTEGVLTFRVVLKARLGVAWLTMQRGLSPVAL